MKRVKQNVQDILLAIQRGELGLADARQLAEELEQELKLYRRRVVLLALLFLSLGVLLTGMLCRKERVAAAPVSVTPVEESAYMPKYTLPAEALWVMRYSQVALDPELASTTNQPLTTQWVKNVAYHLIMGQQALATELEDKAVVHLEKTLTIFPELHGVHGPLGAIYLEQQNLDEAVHHLEEALKEDPSAPTLNNLGAALMRAGETERAEELLLQAKALEPEHPGSYKNLALLYQQMDRPEEAVTHFEQYLALYDEDVEMMERYAKYLLELDRREEATHFLQTYGEAHTTGAVPLYILLAKIEAASTNSMKVVDALEKMTHYTKPTLALIETNREEFDSVRDTKEFQALVHRIELAMVTLEEPQ